MLSEKLKESRNNCNLTQTEVAELLLINVRTVRKYESGTVLPPLDKLKQLSSIYNTSIEFLVSDSTTELEAIKQMINNLNKTDLSMLQHFILNK